jgi:hypothetical protein
LAGRLPINICGTKLSQSQWNLKKSKGINKHSGICKRNKEMCWKVSPLQEKAEIPEVEKPKTNHFKFTQIQDLSLS